MKMSTYRFFVVALIAAGLCCSCKDKKESTTDIIIKKHEVAAQADTASRSPVKMEESTNTTVAEWVGSSYTVDVHRTADESMPAIDDGTGTKYYDNSVLVRIVRKDGSEFFRRVFTKKDFSSYVDKGFLDASVLQAIVYVKAEGDNVVFSVSIGSPDLMSDEFVPLSMTVSRMGAVNIAKMNSQTGDDTDDIALDDEIIED